MRITIVFILVLSVGSIASAQVAHIVPATSQAVAFPIKVGSGALQSNSFYGLLGNGYIADNFIFSSSDYYQFQILAYGSSCQGGWPNMQLDIDGYSITSNIVDSTSPMTVAYQAFVTGGQHQVAVEFTNDCFSSSEDRNLFVKSLTIVPDAPPVTLQAVNFTNRSTTTGMQAASDYWVQLGVGSIDESVTFPQAGYYQFQVTGYGQVCQGGWPVLELDIDGVASGNATFNGALVTNSLQAFVNVGTHDIGLKFTNDCFAPPEDRNLFLKTLTIIPDTVPINLQPANMAIKTSGGSLFGAGDYAQFTNGSVGEVVAFPSAGTYQFQVVAYGSAAANVWPVMALQIDGSTIASVSVNSANPATYNFSASMSSGTHTVALAFTNDAFINGQDRNLFLRSMAITQPQAVVRSVPPTFFGMHVGHFDVKDSIPLNNATFGTFRLWDDYGHLDLITTQWYFVNPSPGTYDYSALDDWITWARTTNNYELIYTFGHTPCWEVPGGVCSQNFENRVHNIADWDAFVTSLVQHESGKIKYYEVWNEADIQYMPQSGDVPLLTLAQHAYSIIKANDPQAIVLTPSSSTGSTFLSNYLATATAPGVAPSFDAIAFHGYAQGKPPENIIGVVNGIRQSAINHGVGSDLLQDTEGSWGVEGDLGDRDEQAAFLARSYVLQASLNVNRFVWYGWNEDLPNNGASWGRIWQPGTTTAGTLLKGGIAFNTISDWLLNAQITACGNPVSGVWSCNITRSTGKPAQILWTDSSDYLVYQVAPQFTQWRDLLNDTPMAVSAGFVILNHKPIMVEVP